MKFRTPTEAVLNLRNVWTLWPDRPLLTPWGRLLAKSVAQFHSHLLTALESTWLAYSPKPIIPHSWHPKEDPLVGVKWALLQRPPIGRCHPKRSLQISLIRDKPRFIAEVFFQNT